MRQVARGGLRNYVVGAILRACGGLGGVGWMGSSDIRDSGLAEPLAPGRIGPLTILIVEDEAGTREVLVDLVSVLGYEARAVEDGPSGVDALAQSSFGLALVDINLPGFNGIELSRRVRRHERAQGIVRRVPIIAMTGGLVADQQEQCRAAGMDDVLLKPCPLATLQATLHRWVGPGVGNRVSSVEAPESAPLADLDAKNADVLDPHALAELRAVEQMTGVPILRRAIEGYLRTSPTTLAAIRQGFAAGDHEAVRVAAHSLKSPSAQLGARRLSMACGELETLARSGRLAVADGVVAALEREFERACQLLERETS